MLLWSDGAITQGFLKSLSIANRQSRGVLRPGNFILQWLAALGTDDFRIAPFQSIEHKLVFTSAVRTGSLEFFHFANPSKKLAPNLATFTRIEIRRLGCWRPLVFMAKMCKMSILNKLSKYPSKCHRVLGDGRIGNVRLEQTDPPADHAQ